MKTCQSWYIPDGSKHNVQTELIQSMHRAHKHSWKFPWHNRQHMKEEDFLKGVGGRHQMLRSCQQSKGKLFRGRKKRFLEWRQLCPTEPCRCLDGSPSKSKHHVSIKWDSFLSKTKGLSHSFSLYFPASILQTEESNQAHTPREVR